MEVGDSRMVLAQASHGALAGTRLLRYLVPYGDAVFNQAQAADLLDDLRQVMDQYTGTPLAEIAARIEPLVQRLGSDTHVYLWFRGD
jgi:hypothetical protein